jgi:branched-chain amino acid transport system ATP-binding protein
VLTVSNLEVVYHDVVLALRGVSLQVPDRQIVALLGANGAGKTTLLRAITGLLPFQHGKITKGTIELDGRRLNAMDSAAIVACGIAQVPEGRRVFTELTVDENLQAGAYSNGNATARRQAQERVRSLFPVLAERRHALAGYLSGGEQQMLAIGRGLMAAPKLLLLDEPSLGLAPLMAQRIRDLIKEINAAGTAVLLVEQNAALALSIAHHGYVLENGRIVMDRPAAELVRDSDVREFYLGLREGGGRKSYAKVKHYTRRKRWLS